MLIQHVYKSLAIVAIATMVFVTSSVQAKGLFIINTGDEVFEVSEEPAITAGMGQGWKLGYACSHFGVLWADAWTWDCKMGAVNLEEFSYSDLPTEILDTYKDKYTMSDAQRGIWNKYGMLLFAGLLVVGGVVKSKSK